MKILQCLPLLLLTACQIPTVYHSYQPIPIDGWSKNDTLTFALPASVPTGTFEVTVGVRYEMNYPYRNLWLAISHNTTDSLTYATDTLQLILADEKGNRHENSPGGLYQCSFPLRTGFPIAQEGTGRNFRIVHIMRDEPLRGLSDVGISITRKE